MSKIARRDRYIFKCTISVLIWLFCYLGINAQSTDSLLLSFQQLGEVDIQNLDDLEFQNTLSGSRTLSQVENLPYTVYIITKEQIQQFGYVTLVDILKAVPGIRVSQPGTGLDGETFIMRGLLGNQYAKILVNDLPVQPTAARSMPIGAQLPIQQAERIEIIFGPTPGLYGADAMAGVINIITEETERPFFVQSNVALGTQGFQNLSVSLGGKLGRDKNVVKFNIFGSYTELEDRPVVFDRDSLYNPLTYADADRTYQRFPNYITNQRNPQNAIIRAFPHNSESIGARLKYREFHIDFEQMSRQDHSALGLNPVSVSLANPLNFTGETITRINTGWAKQMERWMLRIDATNLRYELNPRTSNNYILTTLNKNVQDWANRDLSTVAAFDTANFAALADDIYERYLSRQRYSYANSSDYYIDPLVNFQVNEKLDLSLGSNILISTNQPFVNYLSLPVNDEQVRQNVDSDAVIPDVEKFNNIGLYGQAYLSLKKWSILAVARYDQHSQFEKDQFSRSLAGTYNLTEDLSARISFSSAARTPSSYFTANSIRIVTSPDSAWFELATPNLSRERNNSFEIGMRFGQADRFNSDLTYFRTRTTNLLSFGITESIDNPLVLLAAYGNDPDAFVIIRGFQGRFGFSPFQGTDGFINFQFARGEEMLPRDGGRIERIRGQGKWTWQMRFLTKFSNRWFLQSIHTFSQEWVSRNLSHATDLEMTANNKYIIPGYYNLDLTLRYQLSDEFQGFVQVFNVFNKRYAGIAAGTPDSDLLFNPQALRTFRVGLNYRMR
ncbi:MAG: TonB-dependent receptor [Bacteroidota bacterium]